MRKLYIHKDMKVVTHSMQYNIIQYQVAVKICAELSFYK